MEHTGRCVAVSEPNATYVLATKYPKLGDSPQLRQLARDIIRWECRPYPTMQPPPLGFFLKFHSSGCVFLPMFRQLRRSVIMSLLTYIYQCGRTCSVSRPVGESSELMWPEGQADPTSP